jgi:hypothetical protein
MPGEIRRAGASFSVCGFAVPKLHPLDHSVNLGVLGMTTIYVWATPKLQYNICDHIFLTTFDSPYEGEPPPDSWSCFGQVHSPGSPGVRLIATLPNADVEAACRACRPNVRPADYGISFRYGLDGVGVQLANRILAAASTCKEQVELKDFRGAWLVYGVFGTYGLQTEVHSIRHKLAYLKAKLVRQIGLPL